MQQHTSTTRNQIVEKRNFTLLELLDRLLDKGVMVKGEILLSVADIDLVYLNLGLLLSSVKTIEVAAFSKARSPSETLISPIESYQEECLSKETLISSVERSQEEYLDEPLWETKRAALVPAPLPNYRKSGKEEISASILPPLPHGGLDHYLTPKANIDPKNVEKGLAKLVLTLVDLLRKLMEKQAIRRMEAGQLESTEVEKMGHTFLILDEKIEQLKEVFGLQGEELNLDLGPLGELL